MTKYPADPGIRTSYALLLGENEQTDDAVKILRAQLRGDSSDRDTYLNIAQVYERGRQYKQAEESARAAETTSSRSAPFADSSATRYKRLSSACA